MGMGDNHVYLMDVETRAMIHVFSGHTNYVHSVDTCDNIVASGGEDGSVRLWDMKLKESVHEMKPKDKSDLARPKLGGHVASVAVWGRPSLGIVAPQVTDDDLRQRGQVSRRHRPGRWQGQGSLSSKHFW